MSYAKNTNVSPEKSQAEIREVLRRYGAEKFGTMEELDKAYVMFQFRGMLIQMEVSFPQRATFAKTETGRSRTKDSIDTAHNQAIKQRWRALLLAIKAKLEAVESGISTLEQEFLAFIMLPDGRNVGDRLLPELDKMVETGNMPKMLSYGGG